MVEVRRIRGCPGGPSVRGLFDDCRHALRLYRQTPGASTIAILVVAVSIAFVGAFLSLYADLALRPHPGFEQSGHLATIGLNRGAGNYFGGVSYEVAERLTDEMASIDATGYWRSVETWVDTEREPLVAILVSEEFFPGLGPRIAIGRGLTPADHEPDAEPVVVLSYRYWQQHFGGDPAVLGTEVEISRNTEALFRTYLGPPGSSILQRFEPEQDSARFRIVGVTARSLADLPTAVGRLEMAVWLPLERGWPLYVGVPESLPTAASVPNFVRRAPGASVRAVVNELRARYPDPGPANVVQPAATLDAAAGLVGDLNLYRNAQRQLEMFLAGSVLLALVAAANVSLFLLARGPARRRELGVRMAVGARVGRLARQLAVEAGVIVAVAGTLGLIGSTWLSLYIRGLALFRDAQWRDITLLDWRVLALTGACLLLVTLLVSLAPVLGVRQSHVAASSRLTARASLAQRFAGSLQIAAAGAFAAAAIAFGWHVGVLLFGDPGFEVRHRHVITFSRFEPAEPYSADRPEAERRERSLAEHARRIAVLESVPGVERAAYGEPIPGYDGNSACRFTALADVNDSIGTMEWCPGMLDSGFADVLGLRILHGRNPETFERDVMLVNQTLARSLFGRDDVVGELIPATGREIVGVIEDFSFEHPAAAIKPLLISTGWGNMAVVESPLSAAALRQAIERNIADLGIEAEVRTVESLETLRNDLTAPDRARGFLTLTTAILVVFIAAFGFYGTQRYLVAAGRREYAIRAALGAGTSAIGRLVLVRALQISLPGIAVGGLLAFIVSAYLRGDYVLRDVSPGVVTLLVVLSLASIVLVASIGPAREARRTQPAPLLRQD
jgi:hypothetical protein